MPYTAGPRQTVVNWWGKSDSEAAFRTRGGHALYDEYSISYKINSHGYRCPEFTEVADIRMISIGCSYVFGHSLPQDALFHEMFAERLRSQTGKTLVNWNLSECGTGNDVVERVLHLAVPFLNPHIVLVLFPSVARREYLAQNEVEFRYRPNMSPSNVLEEALTQKIGGIVCQQDDELRFFRSYKSIEALLSDRCWIFGFFDSQWIETSHAFGHLAISRYIGNWRKLDKARDHCHPGPLTNALLYEQFWSTFTKLRAAACCRVSEL
jgi:hypothetical protein